MHALIATDGSEVSIEAARKGVALLNPTKVTLLTVADTSVAEDSGAGGFEGDLLSPTEAEQARSAILDEGDDELAATITAIQVDPAIVERKLVEGASGQMIIHVAGEIAADVIVVGSHGKGWLKRVVIGSISEYVLRHSTIPVLVVRHVEPAGDKG
ncbi:universal stress protein [Dermatobacter hominis]|uniref:universal stress protein n=1 Tax=Dermatobacter hominis TaxID=2884263 RepID=UPI001D11754F|nr:universal stress protein [Dermatobacter hominis]UDY34195.1 universal stress protein [Dermatobacter hominis]